MRAAIYVRVSTDEQAKEGYSLEAQQEKLEAFCFSQGWTIANIYREEGMTAKNTKRPKLKQLLKDQHQFDVVLVYKLDRLSRSVVDINELLQTFEQNSVSFKSATEPYDTTTAQGKLLINIFASLAQFEREQLAERVYMGMTKKATLGERNGGKAPFGYELIDGQLSVKDSEARIVREMFRMYLEGKGMRSIALYLQQFGVSKDIRTIGRMIENPVYCGKLRWGNQSSMESIISEDLTHPPIIHLEDFERAQELRRGRKTEGKKATSPFHFSGVLKCARCGSPLSGYTKKEKGTKHYVCINKKNKATCDLPMFNERALTFQFLEELSPDDPNRFFHLAKDFEIKQKEMENVSQLIEDIEKEMAAIKNRKKNWLMALGNGVISQEEYKSMTVEDTKKEELLYEQLKLITHPEHSLDREAVLYLLESISQSWSAASDFEKKSFINDLFESIIVDVPRDYKRAPGRTPSVLIKEVKLH
jgi:site-specific DNA recombinase